MRAGKLVSLEISFRCHLKERGCWGRFLHDLSFWSNVTMVDGVRGGPWGSVVRDISDNLFGGGR